MGLFSEHAETIGRRYGRRKRGFDFIGGSFERNGYGLGLPFERLDCGDIGHLVIEQHPAIGLSHADPGHIGGRQDGALDQRIIATNDEYLQDFLAEQGPFSR